MPNAKEKDIVELLEILDCFFDPEKKAVQPKPRFFANQNRRDKEKPPTNNKENNEKNINNNEAEGTTDVTSSNEVSPKSEMKQIQPEAPHAVVQ